MTEEPIPILSKILPVELTNRNDGQGHSWFRTAHEKERILRILTGQKREPFRFPVRITVTRILGKRQRLWDADSVLRGNAKQLIDSLTDLGWWVDDSPEWITDAQGHQDATRRDKGPAVLIEVFESESTPNTQDKHK